VSAWFKRFGLHLAAAVGATGIFVAAAAFGANQTRQQEAIVSAPQSAVRTRTPVAPRTTSTTRPSVAPNPAARKVAPERSLAGTINAVLPDGLDVLGVGGREWHVVPAPGALIRLNGKAARVDGLQSGDTVVILGQAQSGAGNPFLAHAITARRK
jgi:hypothetical protein